MILMMNNIPFTGMKDGGFRPTFSESYQPDEPEFYRMIKGLASGKIEKSVPNIGAPIVFVPFMYFSGANSPDELAKSIFVLEAFVLFSLALILVALTARKLFDSRKWAAASAALFTVYPWILLTFFKIIGYKNAIPAFHYQLWIFILSDYLSAFWVYLSFFLIFRWFNDLFEATDIKVRNLIILAAASGAALLTRVGNFWLVLIIAAAFLFFKKFKNAGLYFLALFVMYLPQAVFNFLVFGAPWRYGYRDKALASTASGLLDVWFNPLNLLKNFQKFSPDYYILLAAAFWLVAAAIFIFGYKYFVKINKPFAVISSAWFWSYLIFYGLFDESMGQLRYFLPAIPVFIYFFIAALVYLSDILKEKYV